MVPYASLRHTCQVLWPALEAVITASARVIMGRVLNGDLEPTSPRTSEDFRLVEYKSRFPRHIYVYLGTSETVHVLHDI